MSPNAPALSPIIPENLDFMSPNLPVISPNAPALSPIIPENLAFMAATLPVASFSALTLSPIIPENLDFMFENIPDLFPALFPSPNPLHVSVSLLFSLINFVVLSVKFLRRRPTEKSIFLVVPING